jgi:glutamate synthase (NADPH) small chain
MSEHGVPGSTGIPRKKTYSIHDACSTRYNQKLQDSVREIIISLGYEIEELKYSKEKTKCCGYGGLAYYANKEQGEDFIKERIQESNRDYVAYCSMCRDLFASQGKRTLHLLDLIYGEDLDQLAQKKAPRLWERRINRCSTKARLLKMWNEDYSNYKSVADDIRSPRQKIILSEGIKDLMENRWILLQDIEQVIENAEANDEKFVNPENGHNLARKRFGSTTYWVEYQKQDQDEGYFVFNAYSHRMEVVEE